MDLPVKAEQRLGVTIVALVFGPLFMAGPPVFCVWLALHSTGSTAALLLAGGILCGGWCGYHMIQNYHWVEFDGRRVRGKRFWTRVMVEHDVSDLVEIRPLVSVVKDATTVVTDALIGPCRGWEMVFRAKPSIAVMRGDMKNAEVLIRAVEAKRNPSDAPG